jgi:hypothetical protein
MSKEGKREPFESPFIWLPRHVKLGRLRLLEEPVGTSMSE